MGGHEGNRLPGCQVEVLFQVPQHLTIKNHDGDLVKEDCDDDSLLNLVSCAPWIAMTFSLSVPS